jgi:5-methylcytosine-specific restriction enzyme B
MTESKKQLSVQSIRAAALDLHRWRKSNDAQGAMHLVHLLAAKYAGAKPGVAIPYTEQSVDFTFCDRFLRVNNSNQPYFDPLDMSHRISTHPHSNVATARKKTFSDKWKAGEFIQNGDNYYFQLKADYISTLVKNMAKGGYYTKLNPAAIACWLYREHLFEKDSELNDVVQKFRCEFYFEDDEWQALFESPKDNIVRKLNQWERNRSTNESHTIIDLLTRDVEGFSIYYSLTAIREVCKMPILNPEQIIDIMQTLKCNQVVLQGPPGTEKIHIAKLTAQSLIKENLEHCQSNLHSSEEAGYWGILQLHPSYGYEDFIQRMLPQQKPGEGMQIEIIDMPFVVACKIAEKIKPKPFVLIVDEMNRADLQKVFGELMYALEYREEPLTLQYSRESLVVPDNLFLIGTMNTADSSIIQVDYAIRRRFVFLDVLPDPQIIDSVIEDDLTKKVAIELFKATNIACENHPRFSIGHSYFLHLNIQALIYGFVYQVLPVLRSYQENGVIAESTTIHLKGWDSEPISMRQQRPDVLLESLLSWAVNFE